MRKCCVIQLSKNGKSIAAFIPGYNATKFVNEHDEVLVEGIGGIKGKSKGDIPGIKWKVIQVNGQSLDALVKGRIERARK
jgi:small subunit ribosomal protein S12